MRPMHTLALTALLTGCIFEVTEPGTGDTPEDCAGVVTEWDEPVIASEVTFTCTTRYSGDLSVRSGGHLILEPCAVLELGGGSRIFVAEGGLLEALGTKDCPVTITSSSSAPAAGDWQYIDIGSDADGGSRFEHTIIAYAGGNSSQGAITGGGVFDLVNVTVRGTPGDGLSLQGGRVVALSDLVVEDVGGHPLVLDMDQVEVLDGIEAVTDIGEPSVLVVSSTSLDVDTAWDAESLPYELDGSYNLRADLDIEAGTTLWMAPGTRIIVESGSMDLLGTETDPILVRSAAEIPLPGDWNQVTFKSGSDGSLWQHATVRHGGGNGTGAVRVEGDGRLTLASVVFEDNLDCDVDRTPPTPVDVPATDTVYIDCPY